MDLYCITHDALCCTSCMTQRHRGCGRLIPLDVVAKGVRQAHVLEVVSGDIEDILKTSQILHDNQMENLKQLQTQTDTITKVISDVKQTIVDRLDRFEHALLSELSTMHLIKSSNVEKQDEKISKFIEKAKERKNKLEFIKEYGSNSQVFITLQKLKLSVKEEQKRLKILRHSLKYIYIMYNQQKKQESLSTSLGTLTTKMEPCYHTFPDKRSERKENFDLPVISGCKTPLSNRKPDTLPTSRKLETSASTRKSHAVEPRSGRTSKASSVSIKTKSNSPVNDCKTS